MDLSIFPIVRGTGSMTSGTGLVRLADTGKTFVHRCFGNHFTVESGPRIGTHAEARQRDTQNAHNDNQKDKPVHNFFLPKNRRHLRLP